LKNLANSFREQLDSAWRSDEELFSGNGHEPFPLNMAIFGKNTGKTDENDASGLGHVSFSGVSPLPEESARGPAIRKAPFPFASGAALI
jgi:hypothetical protein